MLLYTISKSLYSFLIKSICFFFFFLNLTIAHIICYVGQFHLSSTSGTKIYVNLEIPEVAELIARYVFCNLKEKHINNKYTEVI